jgi:hypothetical protein
VSRLTRLADATDAAVPPLRMARCRCSEYGCSLEQAPAKCGRRGERLITHGLATRNLDSRWRPCRGARIVTASQQPELESRQLGDAMIGPDSLRAEGGQPEQSAGAPSARHARGRPVRLLGVLIMATGAIGLLALADLPHASRLPRILASLGFLLGIFLSLSWTWPWHRPHPVRSTLSFLCGLLAVAVLFGGGVVLASSPLAEPSVHATIWALIFLSSLLAPEWSGWFSTLLAMPLLVALYRLFRVLS